MPCLHSTRCATSREMTPRQRPPRASDARSPPGESREPVHAAAGSLPVSVGPVGVDDGQNRRRRRAAQRMNPCKHHACHRVLPGEHPRSSRWRQAFSPTTASRAWTSWSMAGVANPPATASLGVHGRPATSAPDRRKACLGRLGLGAGGRRRNGVATRRADCRRPDRLPGGDASAVPRGNLRQGAEPGDRQPQPTRPNSRPNSRHFISAACRHTQAGAPRASPAQFVQRARNFAQLSVHDPQPRPCRPARLGTRPDALDQRKIGGPAGRHGQQVGNPCRSGADGS
jgi:hypothetical protein